MQISKEFPDVKWDKELVDASTARMVNDPASLDTIVATNLHADILSDLAAALAGSLGIAPTGNIDPERRYPSMFEPIHGSAFDIMGKGLANPVGTFWSVVMLLEHLGENDAAKRVMQAIENVTATSRCTPATWAARPRPSTSPKLCANKSPAARNARRPDRLLALDIPSGPGLFFPNSRGRAARATPTSQSSRQSAAGSNSCSSFHQETNHAPLLRKTVRPGADRRVCRRRARFLPPHIASDFKPFGDIFIKLIKMVFAPIIFATVVLGIARMENMKELGRVGVRALIYFEILSTFALLLGLVVVNVVGPGRGMNIDPSRLDTKAIASYTAARAKSEGFIEFVMHLVPTSIVDALARTTSCRS